VFLLESNEKAVLRVLPEAIRTLYSGVSSLKVSIDFLNEKVIELERSLEELSKLTAEYMDKFSKDSQILIKALEDFSEKSSKDMGTTLDLFLGKFHRDIERLVSTHEELLGELSSIRTIIQDKLGAILEVYSDLRNEVLTVKSLLNESIVSLGDLSVQMKANYSSLTSKMHELELLITDLSLRIAKIEDLIEKKE